MWPLAAVPVSGASGCLDSNAGAKRYWPVAAKGPCLRRNSFNYCTSTRLVGNSVRTMDLFDALQAVLGVDVDRLKRAERHINEVRRFRYS